MVRWLDRQLVLALEQRRTAGLSGPRILGPDDCSRLAAYPGWLPPIQAALALRYLFWKRALLGEYGLRGRWPTNELTFAAELRCRIRLACPQVELQAARAWLSWPLRSYLPIGLCLLTLVLALVAVGWQKAGEARRTQLTTGLLEHADTAYRLQLDGKDSGTARDAVAARQRVVSVLGHDRRLQAAVDASLLMSSDAGRSSQEVATQFRQTNQALASFSLYLAAKPVHAACGSGKRCRVSIALPYEVVAREIYHHDNLSYPVVHLRRVNGPLGFLETSVGSTTIGVEGSEVYDDRVHDLLVENLLPVLVIGGQSWSFPWLSDSADVAQEVAQSVSKTLQGIYAERLGAIQTYAERVVRVAELSKQARLHRTLLDAGHRAPDDEQQLPLTVDDRTLEARSVMAEMPKDLDLLEKKLKRAVAYHEVEHQIHDRTPSLLQSCHRHLPTIAQAAANSALPAGLCDEAGALLVELYYAPGIRHLLLCRMLASGLNTVYSMTRSRLAAQLVISALDGAAAHSKVSPRLGGTLALQAAFSVLNKLDDDELAALAQRAYLVLIERPLPIIKSP